MNTTKHTPGDLQVWWIPQVPGKPFSVNVANIREAKLLLDALAEYDIFQFKNRIKPDYCNAGGLRTWDGSDWEDWYDEDGKGIDYIEIPIASAPDMAKEIAQLKADKAELVAALLATHAVADSPYANSSPYWDSKEGQQLLTEHHKARALIAKHTKV